jgi:FixJ family two-component response regulator
MSARNGLTNEQMESMNFFNIMNTSILQARYRQLMDKKRVNALTERDKEVLEKIVDELIDRGA